ncbi:MAG: FIST N-terminal domain-containing protein [Candidatus ainarchaeum sp.]|nr:FIST N-terminal domain-containing protein [Candidatus ainarchaeum sp.]
MVFEVGIGTSQNWDPEKAAEEAILNAKKSLSGNPSLCFMFSTIHYAKNNGFKKILNKIFTKIPVSTPLVGCTTPGYITNCHCGTKGIIILLINSEEIQVFETYATKTKQAPIKAVKKVINQIKKFEPQNYKNKILIEFTSGPTMPTLPIFKKINLIKSQRIGNIFCKLLPLTSIIGYGVAKDDEILNIIDSELKDYYLIGGANIDDGNLSCNYQFFKNKVLTNSIVGLCIYTNKNIIVDGFLEMQKASNDFEITKTDRSRRIIKEIENFPATEKFLEKTGLDEIAFKNKSLLYRTTLFYPVGFTEKPNSSTAIGAIYGNNILLGHKLIGNKCYILSSSGKFILETPMKLEKYFSSKKSLMFVSGCETGLEALGKKIYIQQEKLLEFTHNTPFITIFFGGEHYKKPNEKSEIRTHSFNSIII